MEHQKGAGERGEEESNPAPAAGNIQIAPTGDRGGMGHRGASANDGGHGGICGAGAGNDQAAGESAEGRARNCGVVMVSCGNRGWGLPLAGDIYPASLSRSTLKDG